MDKYYKEKLTESYTIQNRGRSIESNVKDSSQIKEVFIPQKSIANNSNDQPSLDTSPLSYEETIYQKDNNTGKYAALSRHLSFDLSGTKIDVTFDLAPENKYDIDHKHFNSSFAEQPKSTGQIELSINGVKKSFFDLKDTELLAIVPYIPAQDNAYSNNKDLSERLLSADLNKTPPSKAEKIDVLQGMLDRGYTAAGISLMNYYKEQEKSLKQSGNEEKSLDASRTFDEIARKVDDQIKITDKNDTRSVSASLKNMLNGLRINSIRKHGLTQGLKNAPKIKSAYHNDGYAFEIKDVSALIKSGYTDTKAVNLLNANKHGKSVLLRSLTYVAAPGICAALFGITIPTLTVCGLAALGAYGMLGKEKPFAQENRHDLVLGAKSMAHSIGETVKATVTATAKDLFSKKGER